MMDSSNSGSFQSSSGGAGDNDEFDSTTYTHTHNQTQSSPISSFFNNHPASTNFNPNLNHLFQPPPTTTFYNNPPPNPNPNHLQHQHPSSTTYLPDFPSINPNPRSDHNHNHNHHNRHQIGVTVKKPKKRTRASRRAPTTVLTTDTTNFRQMVQEFTGIPTAPFTTASTPFSRRLDLFSSSPAAAIGSLNMNTLRPPANKVQPQTSFLNANNSIESGAGHTNNTPTATTTTSSNYNFASYPINDFHKQPSTFLDLQNPMFSFQSLLQTNNDFTASKRWRDQNGKLEGFEGEIIGNSQNIGGSKLNSSGSIEIENVLVASRSGSGSGVGDQVQVQGNEGSWICPSN